MIDSNAINNSPTILRNRT